MRKKNRLPPWNRGNRRRRGVVALEYILICGFMAVAFIGLIAYLRRTLSRGSRELTQVAAIETSSSVKEAMDELGR